MKRLNRHHGGDGETVHRVNASHLPGIHEEGLHSSHQTAIEVLVAVVRDGRHEDCLGGAVRTTILVGFEEREGEGSVVLIASSPFAGSRLEVRLLAGVIFSGRGLVGVEGMEGLLEFEDVLLDGGSSDVGAMLRAFDVLNEGKVTSRYSS